MSKAIEGVALLGGAIATLAVAAVLASTGVGIALIPVLMHAAELEALAGASMLAGAAASALTSNRGMNITTRQAAAYRQVIYGEQRVGGVIVYQSTTGGHKDQYNYVIVISAHEVDSIVNLYLDGREVFWEGSGVGNTTRNGVNFGGNPDGNNHPGPNGVQYNFGGALYCEARFGDQAADDVIGGLTANDPNWAASGGRTPALVGCCYVYLKLEYNTTTFPQLPEIRFTVRGKNNIYDPRTKTSGYTTNAALIAADVFTDSVFGLGDPTVNQAQLIAAANVCDEQVALARGGTESRYSASWHFDTSTSPGMVLATIMDTMAGRFARSNGEWYIFPAYWQGPTFSFDESVLADRFQWNPYRPKRDLFNRATGTYTAPNYPYNVQQDGSDLYDTNGFYDGQIQNNFPFAFQPTSIPYYAEDSLHGFATDQYLTADGGRLLTKDFQFPACLSVSQAQRLLKINLERNRQLGSSLFTMFPVAFQMMQLDVMAFTFPKMGWAGRYLEVNSCSMTFQPDENGVPRPRVMVGVNDTAASVYEWNTGEELSIYVASIGPGSNSYQVQPPTNFAVTSGAAYALVGADGVVTPRVAATWTAPADVLVTQLELQVQGPIVSGEAVPGWSPSTLVGSAMVEVFLYGVIAGQTYNFQIRSVRANGATSAWEGIAGYTVATTLSTLGQNAAIAPQALVAESFSDGTAAIIVEPFTAVYGQLSVQVLPSGPFTIPGLSQQAEFYVFYYDPTFAGGAVTPVAATSLNQYLGQVGWFYVGAVTTPYAGSGGATVGARYYPTSYSDTGTRSTTNPTAAYDGNLSTCATISGSSVWIPGTGSGTNADAQELPDPGGGGTSGRATISSGICSYAFSGTAAADASAVLTVVAAINANAGTGSITAIVGGTSTTMVSSTSTAASQTYTLPIAQGTALSTVTVQVEAAAQVATQTNTSEAVSVLAYEIYIQT